MEGPAENAPIPPQAPAILLSAGAAPGRATGPVCGDRICAQTAPRRISSCSQHSSCSGSSRTRPARPSPGRGSRRWTTCSLPGTEPTVRSPVPSCTSSQAPRSLPEALAREGYRGGGCMKETELDRLCGGKWGPLTCVRGPWQPPHSQADRIPLPKLSRVSHSHALVTNLRSRWDPGRPAHSDR